MKSFYFVFLCVFLFSLPAFSQIPSDISLLIIKAEDERRFDRELADLAANPNPRVRERAALAIGRIGDEQGLPVLEKLFFNNSDEIRAMAAFAIGEIESINGAEQIKAILENRSFGGKVRMRAIEAAGKIAQANPKEEKARMLGEAILDALKFENERRSAPDIDMVLMGLTAVLRARPEKAEVIVSKFLTYSNVKIRQNASNTLARLRAKDNEINALAKAMLLEDNDPICRANACRILGPAGDSSAIPALFEAALKDRDARVRVSAIRALANFKDAKELKELGVADKLIERGGSLAKNYRAAKGEILEIVNTLGRLMAKSEDDKAVEFLRGLYERSEYLDAEIPISWARISPKNCLENCGAMRVIRKTEPPYIAGRLSSIAQAYGELANAEDKAIREKAEERIREILKDRNPLKKPGSLPDELRAFAAFKSADAGKIIIPFLGHKDIYVRAAAAEILGDLPSSKESLDAMNAAFSSALKSDKDSNDAQLALLSNLVKLDAKSSFDALRLALDAPDYLVRKSAADLIKGSSLHLDKDFNKDLGEVSRKLGNIRPYDPRSATKLGQILYRDSDYIRAISRKNGKIKALFATEKGPFSIELMPEDAPLTVDNFIGLARSGYFNGLSVHRVVPNFVMQDGDPRGDGNGGPGWQIRCEVNMLEYGRGAVGMALSGKDTGGSQWFITHSPQPHLDGGYTVFGKAGENSMEIVDRIQRGDKIISVKIIEDEKATPAKAPARGKKKGLI